MKRIVAVTAGSLVGVLGLSGLAYAGTTTGPTGPSPTTSSPTGTGHLHPGRTNSGYGPAGTHHLGPLRRAVHTEAVVRGKGHTFHTWQLDRGLFASVSPASGAPTSITITRPDGVKVTAPVTSATKFPGLAENKLATGDRVVIVQRDGTATRVGAYAPKSTPPAPKSTP